MIKLLTISALFGLFFSLITVIADAYPTLATPHIDPVSTPVALLLLGSGMIILSQWGKRPEIKG